MKTDKDSKEIIMGIIILILLGLLMFTCSKNKPQILASSFSADNTTELQYERQNSQYLTEMIHAYNLVLHRVWIDRPEYVEDALCESPEYIRLEQFIDPGTYNEIFSFYDEEDSLTYHLNWNSHEGEPKGYRSPIE